MNRLINVNLIRSPNQVLAWWLVHCFLYYRACQPVLKDRDFDKLTQRLKEEWDFVNHPHKSLVSMEDLNAGSGYAIQYPLSVEGAAWQLLRDLERNEQPTKTVTKIKAKIIKL